MILMQRRRTFKQRLRRLSAMVATLAVLSAFAAVFVSVTPASAAAPFKPPTGVIDCTDPTEASSDACARLDAAPDCITSDTQCFADELKTFPAGTDTWWLDPTDGVLCAGSDNACRNSIADPGTTWVLDHQGASPNIAADEQPGPIPPSIGPAPPNFINVPGSGQQACAGTVNQFSTCSITTLSGGLEFFALVFAVGGILVSTILWILGSKSQNPGQEVNGKRGLFVSVVAAIVVGAIPGITLALNHDAKGADSTGVTSSLQGP
jgi:hypothetical protein